MGQCQQTKPSPSTTNNQERRGQNFDGMVGFGSAILLGKMKLNLGFWHLLQQNKIFSKDKLALAINKSASEIRLNIQYC